MPRRTTAVREGLDRSEPSSAGHQLGQAIGDWWEECVALPLLANAAARLRVFLDTRFVSRECRGEKLEWRDSEGNTVDYDFVFELGGTKSARGVPVAFVESFWRRGARHSKDKARDDSGKLTYMREVHPTARFLGIVASGEFTEPARDLVRSREIELFFIPKEKIVEAFAAHRLVMDYPDALDEAEKQQLAAAFLNALDAKPQLKQAAAATLRTLVGNAAWDGYAAQIHSRLSATPTSITFIRASHSAPASFDSVHAATLFLNNPSFGTDEANSSFLYRVLYSDGSSFTRDVSSIDALRALHGQLELLSTHMDSL